MLVHHPFRFPSQTIPCAIEPLGRKKKGLFQQAVEEISAAASHTKKEETNAR
jgi:hypothetical protein